MVKWITTLTVTSTTILITVIFIKSAMDVVNVLMPNAVTSQPRIIPTTAHFIRSGGSQMNFNLAMMTAEEDFAHVSVCTRQDTKR